MISFGGIDNIDFESGKVSDFLDTLQHDTYRLGIDSIIIRAHYMVPQSYK